MKLALKKLLQANPSIQVSTLLSGSLSTPSAKGAFSLPTFALLGEEVLTSTSSSITFSNLNTAYTHLRLVCYAKTTITSNTADNMLLRFNSDTGSNYSRNAIAGNYLGFSHFASINQTYIELGIALGDKTSSPNTQNMFAMTMYTIPNFTSSAIKKSVHILSGYSTNVTNGGEIISTGGGSWNSTNAITSLTIVPPSGSFKAGSAFRLYGMRTA